MKKNHLDDACTTILVGKNASLDGSTMIARNDDTFFAVAPHSFVLNPAVEAKKAVKLNHGLTDLKEKFLKMATNGLLFLT